MIILFVTTDVMFEGHKKLSLLEVMWLMGNITNVAGDCVTKMITVTTSSDTVTKMITVATSSDCATKIRCKEVGDLILFRWIEITQML